MNSFFNSVKQTLGIKDDKNVRNDSSSLNEFDVTFSSQSLGIIVIEHNGRPVVEKVSVGSTASKSGVKAGDLIICLEGNKITSFEDFSAVIGGLDYRPLIIRFRRIDNSNTSSSSSSASSIWASITPSSNTVESNLTDEEKEQRRSAMIQAAKIRSKQLNGLSVTVSGTKKKTEATSDLNSISSQDTTEPSSEETERLIRKVKLEEQRMVQAHMSSTTEAKTQINNVKHGELGASSPIASPGPAASGPSPASPVRGPARIVDGVLMPRGLVAGQYQTEQASRGVRVAPEPEPFDVGDDVLEQIDEAISLVVSTMDAGVSADGGSARAEQTLRTVGKLLSALVENMGNAKYRTIRVLNPRFQERVMTCPGGADLMLSAGFFLTAQEQEAGGTEGLLVSSSPGEEVYFHHNCHEDVVARAKLVHASRRVAETLAILYPDVQTEVNVSSVGASKSTPAQLRSTETRGLDPVITPSQGGVAIDQFESADSKRERMLKAVEQRNKTGTGKSGPKKVGRLP